MPEKIIIDFSVQGAETLANAFKKIGKEAEKTGKKGGKSFTEMNQALELATKGVDAFKRTFGKLIEVGSEFEKQMSVIASISKTTSAEFKALSDEAKRLGRETVFTATQAAQGMEQLKRAGLSTTKVIQATQHAMSLSNATGLELSKSAQVIANSLEIFKDEALNAEKAVDLITQTAAASTTTAIELKYALETSSATAKGAGLSFQQLTSILGVMAANGVRGEKAGTALNGALARLISPTKEVYEAMERLHLTHSELNPLTNDFSEIMHRIAASGADAGDILELLGREAGPKFISIFTDTSNVLEDFNKKQKEQRTAAEAAAVAMDNLQGDTLLFKSALSGLSTEIYENLSGGLRGIVQLSTRVMRSWEEMVRANQANFGYFLINLGDGLIAIDQSFGSTFKKVKDIVIRVFETISNAFKSQQDDISDTISAFGPLYKAFVDLAETVTRILQPVVEVVLGGLLDFVVKITGGLAKATTAVVKFANDGILYLEGVLKNPLVMLEKLKTSVKSVLDALGNHPVVKKFIKFLNLAAEAAFRLADELSGHSVTTAAEDTDKSLLELTGNGLKKVGKSLVDRANEAKGFSEKIDEVGKKAEKASKKIVAFKGIGGLDFDRKIGEQQKEAMAHFGQQIGGQITGVSGAMQGAQFGPWGALAGALLEIALKSEAFSKSIQKLNSTIATVLEPLFEAMVPLLDAIVPLLEELAPAIKIIAKVVAAGMTPFVKTLELVNRGLEKFSSAIWTAYDFYKMLWSKIKPDFDKLVKNLELLLYVGLLPFKAILSPLVIILESLYNAIKKLTDAFKNPFGGSGNAISAVFEILSDPFGSISTYIQNSRQSEALGKSISNPIVRELINLRLAFRTYFQDPGKKVTSSKSTGQTTLVDPTGKGAEIRKKVQSVLKPKFKRLAQISDYPRMAELASGLLSIIQDPSSGISEAGKQHIVSPLAKIVQLSKEWVRAGNAADKERQNKIADDIFKAYGLVVSEIAVPTNAKAVENMLNLIASFERGGYIPKAQGGMLVGNRHSGGGIPIEAEGGEFIMSRNAVERIGADNLRAMNNGTGGSGVNITMNIKAIDPRSQKEELRQVMEELFLSGRLRVA